MKRRSSKLMMGVVTMMTLMGSMAIPTYGSTTDIELIVDNKLIEFDVAPTIVSDRTMVPLRGVFEALNITPKWDSANKRVLVRGKGVDLILPVDSNEAILNGKKVKLDAPASILNGRTMVPVRFISESCGADVSWNEDSKTVTIKSNIPNKESGNEHNGSSQEGHEGNGEKGDSKEEDGTKYSLNQRFDKIRKGARLVMEYDSKLNSFKGVVSNTTNKTLSDVRIEIHLNNGLELGPTIPVDLMPGKSLDVEMKASRLPFTMWTPHAEVGAGEGSEGNEGSEGRESSSNERDGNEGSEGRETGDSRGEGSENHGREGGRD